MRTPAVPLSTIREARELFHSEPKSVLFYADDVNSRLLKMAWGLRRIGWRVGLVYLNTSFFDTDQYFDAVFKASDAKHAYDLAINLDPSLYHVFTGAIDQRTVDFCHNKPGPVVLDLYDLWTGAVMKYAPERFGPTLEAVSLADGLCARDKRFVAAKAVDAMALPRHCILYSDYCWDAELSEDERSTKNPNEVHVVSVGALFLDAQIMNATKLLTDNGIHFHIYPRWHFDPSIALETVEVSFREYLALEKTTPYLHIHRPVPLEQLYRELRRYDFGLVINGFCDLGYVPWTSMITDACLASAYAMRTSDYLDAGLPVLINEELSFLSGILKRLGMFVDASVMLSEDCKRHLLERKNVPDARTIADKARTDFSIMQRIGRLDRFYCKVLRDGPTMRTPHSMLRKSSADANEGVSTAQCDAQYDDESRYAKEYRHSLARDNYTLLIPTYNRPRELAVLLGFLGRQHAEFPILVLDSSSQAISRQTNAKTVGASGLNVRHLCFDSTIQPFEKMWRGSQEVQTQYCGMCADDDIIMPDSLDPLLSFLEDKPDYAAAHGWYYWFSLERETMDMRLIAFSTPSVKHSDPLVRLRNLFIDYESPTYAVYRTSIFQDIFSRIQGMNHVWAHESLSCALLLVYGKVARIPVFYYGRSGGVALDLGPSHPLDIMVHSVKKQFELYAKSREILLERLEALYPDRFPTDTWGQYLDLIYMMYFSDIYKKHILNSAFEQSLALDEQKGAGKLEVNYRLGICQLSLAPPTEPAAGPPPLVTVVGFKQRLKQSRMLQPLMEPVLLPLWRFVKRVRNTIRAMQAPQPPPVQDGAAPAIPQDNVRKSQTLNGHTRLYLLGSALLNSLSRDPVMAEPERLNQLLTALDDYDFDVPS